MVPSARRTCNARPYDSNRGIVQAVLHKLHDDGNTIVLITHDNSIAATAERIIRLEDGHVVYDGPAHAADAGIHEGGAGS